MNRVTLMVFCVALFGAVALRAQDSEKAQPAQPSLAEQLKGNPDDVQLFQRYMNQSVSQIRDLLSSDPKQAIEMLDEMSKVIGSLMPTTDEAKQRILGAQNTISQGKMIASLNLVSLDELAKKLTGSPGDAETLNMYLRKLSMTVMPLAEAEPEKAEKILQDAEQMLAKLMESTEQESLKANIERLSNRIIAGLKQRVEMSKRLAVIVGMDAAPLAVEAWVNGEPLTDEDLKGKVVLLDFWAVWCGPCIQTFPHLRKLQEEYGDKGLVIVGLTNYYNYAWDEESGHASRSDEEVPHDQEQQMLGKFAEQHNLHHRIAIQKDSSMSEYYAVSGIPHVVVVDQEGKVRLYKIGSGPENAEAIETLIKELLAKS